MRVLVYTSSTDVVLDSVPRQGADETTAKYPAKPINEYVRTKVAGEQIVLRANGKRSLLTCAIRPCHLYGPGDPHAIAHSVDALRKGLVPFLPGDGSARFGIVYVDNVAHAHILAADSLHTRGEHCDACVVGWNVH